MFPSRQGECKMNMDRPKKIKDEMKTSKRIPKFLFFCIVWMPVIQVGAEPFDIVQNGESVSIVFDQTDAEVIGISAKALAEDIKLITGVLPDLSSSLKAS